MAARLWIVGLSALIAGTTAIEAQTRRASMLPAETPPADFAETQYIDSRGCAFVRAALNGQVTWLPQFDEERQPLCGLEPSLFAGTAAPSRVVIRETPEDVQPPEARTAVADSASVEESASVGERAPPAEPPSDADTERLAERPAESEDAELEAAETEIAGSEPAAPETAASEVVLPADPDSPVVIVAAGQRPATPRYTLRVIERRGTVIEVPPDPYARSVLTVIEQRGQLFYPDI